MKTRRATWLERLQVDWMALWLTEEGFAAWMREKGYCVRWYWETGCHCAERNNDL